MWFGKKRVRPKIDDATKEEVLRLLAGIQQSRKSRYSGLVLMLKIGSGYAAMALFTVAALTFSTISLYSIHSTVREITNIELPVVTSLNKLRGSVLAQENLSGKYAILRDPKFLELYRQREQETLDQIELLEKVEVVSDVENLKRLYGQFRRASQPVFAGTAGSYPALRNVGAKVVAEIDALYLKHQETLQVVLGRADRMRQTAIKWTIMISCCGFVFAIAAAALIAGRMLRALKRLQTATRHIAAGDFSYDPMIPVGEELSDLADDFREMAEKLQAIHEMRKGNAQPVANEGKPPT